ncbi:hypothetical protein EJB05_07097 [Eragrostis curvula]|uniref:Uncharacterized protein n=1 Tax=Eragrostis curvula TaxID=38414 RepID=A0A5J9WJS2_9POAL|nr:hypothetical protein EJB05_07097 [Eragrostis curvula]
MSWLRSAVHRAVEASGGPSSLLTRTVRSSLGTVVHHAGQAVVGGARLITGNRTYKSVKLTAKRLEDAALSCRGEERAQLLRRWVAALKGTQRAATETQEPQLGDDPDQAAALIDLYVDYESGSEPMNFLHVFLYSEALECVVLSMVGGKDVHSTILSSIKDLASLFSSYHDEVLAKRDELLQFTQGAISGLKINAEIARLDEEILQLQKQINAMDARRASSARNPNKIYQTVTEGFKNAVAEARLCARMEELVDKLKILSESLANSSSRAEKRIMENRLQREESLIFRVTKTKEVSGIEKELVAEISGLKKQRDQLEEELTKVNTKLNAVTVKLKKTREERDQFDEASNQIVLHLKTKEDELSRSVGSCKVEASTVSAWINFLEDTWKLQSSNEELKEKQANDELDRCGVCFAKLIKHHVSACMEDLSTSIDHIKTCVDNLKIFNERSISAEDGDNGSSKQSNPRKYLEQEYLETEKKVVAAFSLADSVRALFCSDDEGKARRDDPEVKNLFANIDKLRIDFESVPRPVLQIEIKEQEERTRQPRSFKPSISPNHSRCDSPMAIAPQLRTRLPSESDSEMGKFDQDYKADEISGWEFDELEDEPRSGFP